MIDPIHSLAFAIHSNPGVYALLLGSGVSRAAQIPTGYEITLDLVKKLAGANGVHVSEDSLRWYREKFGKEPSYSDLLNSLARLPSERQRLLQRYFEPTDEEQEENLKQPTKAHRAIAEIMKRGFVRVVVTTNFDRLLETALNDLGVTPIVISSEDHIRGALPLVHADHVIIKIHGDYLDARIQNTEKELSGRVKNFV